MTKNNLIIVNPTIGSDVEFFVQDQATKEIVSAEGFILGTKSNPYKFDQENPYFATSLDNVLAEGNIPPTTNKAEFYQFIDKLNQKINEMLPQGLCTVAQPSARLDYSHLMTDNAQIFGCEPSLNCWTGTVVQPMPSGDNLRSAGFHIHIGYNNPNHGTNMLFGKAMDLFVGLASVLLEPANERKAVGYGCAGNIRHQKHGCEYRSLSSYFASSQKLIEWCFDRTMDAINFINNGRIPEIMNLGSVIQDTINNENKEVAENLVKQFNIPLI